MIDWNFVMVKLIIVYILRLYNIINMKTNEHGL